MTSPPGDEERLAEQIEYYRSRAPEYDEWFRRDGRYDHGESNTQQWLEETAALGQVLAARAPFGRVLELAPGTGWWTEQLLPGATSITAVDASEEMIEHNRRRTRSDVIEYVHSDIFDWEPTQAYDLVFFSFWLSHVPPSRFEGFWELVRRSLAPGGRVLFFDSATDSRGTARDQPVEPRRITQERRLNDGRTFEIFKVYYAPTELERELARLGWAVDVRGTARFFIWGTGSPTGT